LLRQLFGVLCQLAAHLERVPEPLRDLLPARRSQPFELTLQPLLPFGCQNDVSCHPRLPPTCVDAGNLARASVPRFRIVSPAPLRVALIGLGRMGRVHAEVIGGLACVELRAVAEERAEAVTAAAQLIGAARVCGSADEA